MNPHRVDSSHKTTSYPSSGIRQKRDTGVRDATPSLLGRTQGKGRGEGGGGAERGRVRDGDGDCGRGGKVGGGAEGKGGGERGRSRGSVREEAHEKRRGSQTRENSGESKSSIITRLEKEVLVSVCLLLSS